MRGLVRNIFAAGIFLMFAAQTIYSQTDQLPRGTVIENVICLENKEQSYSLYLPSKYTPDKKWPVLYAFDPFARGKAPVDVYREAAEKYSYIIAGSNNSKNGLGGQQQSDIITTLWKDTHARFSIDEKRAYATGLSGGARVANYFAYTCKGCIAGVISSGAGFLPALSVKDGLPYVFFGTIGVDDFNYAELIDVEKTLTEASGPHRLTFFDAGHQWPPGEVTFDALAWFDLQAMKSGRMEKRTGFIESIFSLEKTRAEMLFQKGKILETWRGYRSLVDDFRGLAETTESEKKLAELAANKELKEALKQESGQIAKQKETLQRIVTLSTDLTDDDKKPDAFRRLSLEIGALNKASEATQDSGERRYARRSLFAIFSYAYESAMYADVPKKEYKSAEVKLELAALVYPKSKNIQLELARMLALDGRNKDAVKALGRAVENGFNDCAIFGKDAVFAALRVNKDFVKLKTAAGCIN